MPRVHKAQPPRHGAMGSLGDAIGMLIRQFNFPYDYDARDRLLQIDQDRLLDTNHRRVMACFQKHTGSGDVNFGRWVVTASDAQIIAFLKEALSVLGTEDAVWTGYRILGTVRRGNGQQIWGLELFAKHPDSKTKVYTGPDAPNVIIKPRGTLRSLY